MDPSKTLVQARRSRSWAPPANDVADAAAGSTLATAPDGPRISASDERSRRRGELLLGRYRLFERLGAGGFGTVWRAHDEQLDRAVAVKRIPLPSARERERATREALATARLSHPAIVALYEASADEDAFYLISELVEGDTLARLIADDELCDEEIVEIGVVLVEALEHAHARGVIHRDVKPQNVLVPSDTTEQTPSRGGGSPAAAKLADFGGARLAGDDALTLTGDVYGTLAYMAPEQSEGHEAGPPADLYSLALVLYEAFSGVNPVRGRTPAATAKRIGAPIEPLERRRRDLPRELTRALDVALDPDPDRRGTLAELHQALEQALERGFRRRLFPRRQTLRLPFDPQPEWSAPEESATPGAHRAGAHRAGGHTAEERHAGARRDEGERAAHTPGRHAAPLSLGAGAAGDADGGLEEHAPERHSRRRMALPRLVWIGCLLAAVTWQAAEGRAGVSLLLLAGGVPLLVMPRRSGPGWLAAGLAPALGVVGLAGAFPALAGQRAGWRARGALAALGFWWLALAEPLLARRLWLGPSGGTPPRAVWEASFGKAAAHVVGATLTFELLLGAAVWALAATILPWIVRGRSAALDVAAAVAWTVALVAATPLLAHALLAHASQPSPRGALVGAVLGCALAIGARALRGPV